MLLYNLSWRNMHKLREEGREGEGRRGEGKGGDAGRERRRQRGEGPESRGARGVGDSREVSPSLSSCLPSWPRAPHSAERWQLHPQAQGCSWPSWPWQQLLPQHSEAPPTESWREPSQTWSSLAGWLPPPRQRLPGAPRRQHWGPLWQPLGPGQVSWGVGRPCH